MNLFSKNTGPGPILKTCLETLACLLLLTLLWLPAPVAAETLTAGVVPWAPWIIKDKDRYTGIAVEICQEAFRRAGHTCLMVEIPVKRRDMLEWGRRVDVEPGCEKMWRVQHNHVSVYTEPYIQTRNVIVAPRGCYPATQNLTTFYGTTMGANAGYYYTDGLSQAFDQGLITRDDCGPGPLLVAKLLKKRFNAIVADTFEWKYWISTLGRTPSGFEEPYIFSHTNNLRIRLHRDKAHLVSPLNQALDQMQDDGTIQAIVTRYLPE